MNWIMSANKSIYDYDSAFANLDVIYWRQNRIYEVGDTIYIYGSKPDQRIRYKVKVIEVDIPYSEKIDNDSKFFTNEDELKAQKNRTFMRIKKIASINSELLNLNYLQANGLNGRVQGGMHLSNELSVYIESIFNKKITSTSNSSSNAAKLNAIDLEVAEQLLLAIKNGLQRISYKDLSEKTKSKPNPHFGLTESLYRIGNLCFDLGLPFITFLVVSEGKSLPGEGCRALFTEHGINVDDMTTEEIYKREKERIINCTEWQKLSDYLGLNIITSVGGEVVFPDEIPKDKKCIEGAKKTIKVNAYERDRDARRQCLNYYKEKQGRIKCQICGFDFGKFYGEKYNNLIHVHHIREISSIGEAYEVNPIKDLIPVCPNCHMVLHSKLGESIEELKAKFANNK